MHSSRSASDDPDHVDYSTDRPLANQLVSAASRFARVVTQVSDIPISAVSMRALGYIQRQGPQRISQMAAYESISQPAMTSAINRLEADGLIERQPDPADARAQLIELTHRGADLLEAYRGQVAEVLQPKLQDLPATDYATITRVVELLERLTDELIGNA